MEWFTGGVIDAITACRREQALFVVYLYDDSSASANNTAAWNSTTVFEVVSANKTVAIKVAKDSIEHQQFAQLFPVLVFPSTFCIGLMGQPLVIMNGEHSSAKIRDKLSDAFEQLRAEVESLSRQQVATPPQPQATPTQLVASSPPPSSDSLSPSQPPPPPSSDSLSPSQPPPPSSQSSPSPPSSSLAVRGGEREEGEGEEEGEGGGECSDGATGGSQPKEERVERAHQKIKERRLEKEGAEYQREKQGEMQRRQGGRQLARTREEQEQRRNEGWIQERRRAKEEEKRAREAVKANLRQDQMEREAQRRAREGTTSEVRHRSTAHTTSPPQRAAGTHTSNGACRLALKLPSGGSSVLLMKKDDTLASLRERVSEEVFKPPSCLILFRAYPRLELTEEMDDQTLDELSLAPSGTVVIRVGKSTTLGGGTPHSGQGQFRCILYVFQLILNFLSFVKNAILGLFGMGGGGGGGGESESLPHGSQDNQSPAQNSRPYGSTHHVRKFRPGDYDTDEEEEDDDSERRTTYNGNSTEQQ